MAGGETGGESGEGGENGNNNENTVSGNTIDYTQSFSNLQNTISNQTTAINNMSNTISNEKYKTPINEIVASLGRMQKAVEEFDTDAFCLCNGIF